MEHCIQITKENIIWIILAYSVIVIVSLLATKKRRHTVTLTTTGRKLRKTERIGRANGPAGKAKHSTATYECQTIDEQRKTKIIQKDGGVMPDTIMLYYKPGRKTISTSYDKAQKASIGDILCNVIFYAIFCPLLSVFIIITIHCITKGITI